MEGGPLLTEWWQEAATEVVPYLNIEARWDGAPDQGLLKAKGGRGFPYCTLMNSDGEVIWELRPSSAEAWRAGLDRARRLRDLQAAAAKAPADRALAASVALLEAMGRSQRPAAPLEELDAHAVVDGIDGALLAAWKTWRRTQTFMQAYQRQRSDKGAAAYALFQSGDHPDDQSEQLQFSFYRAALEGAIDAGAKDDAAALLERWRKSAGDPDWKEWVERQVDDYEKRIEAIGDA